MTQADLDTVLVRHEAWVRGEAGGERAILTDAILTGASLRRADLTRAILCGCDLTGADLTGAILRGCDLTGADLTGADLTGAILRGCDLTRAILCGCDLTGADLTGVILRRGTLTGAILRRADLTGSDLTGAILTGADLRRANLSQTHGITWASVGWSSHGECGRMLLAVLIDGETRFFCGCFSGTLDELRKFIANREEQFRNSRTLAVDFCLARITEAGSL